VTEGTADVHCPRCGAAAERGQLVCLECGARVALVYRRPPSWKVPVAITAVVALLLGVGAFMAVSALSDDADREVAAAPPRPKPVATKTTGAKAEPDKPKDAAPAAAGDTIVKRGSLYQWPRTLEGYTVVINSTEDRASATSFARSAARAKAAKLGVIRADDFKTLPQGFYVVFAGFYEDRGKADEATERLNRRYPGSFTQAVER
jgi:septal ring-binding cell division protein DamX